MGQTITTDQLFGKETVPSNRGFRDTDSSNILTTDQLFGYPLSISDIRPIETPSFRQGQSRSTWDNVLDFFGPNREKEAARASNALVYSEMFNIRPSIAYEYHDQIFDQLKQRGAEGAKSGKGIGAAAEAGWESSLTGMIIRRKVPDPFESSDQMERWIQGIVSMGVDLPIYLAAYGASTAAAIETGPAAPIVGMTAAFGLTQGMRQALMDIYGKGEVTNFRDLMTRTKDMGLATIKGSAVGATMAATGAVMPGGPILKALSELATMTTVSKVIEGQVPTLRDFLDNAPFLIPIAGAMGLETARGALQDHYVKTGQHPSDVVRDVQGKERVPDPTIEPTNLRPAVKVGEQVFIGAEGETHPDVLERTGEPPVTVAQLRQNPSLADYVLKRPGIHDPDVMDAARAIKEGKPTTTPAEGEKAAVRGAEGEPERGFVDPDGNFLTREQAEKWTKENQPDVHEAWQDIAGEGAEFHSEDYSDATERVSAREWLERNQQGYLNLSPAVQAIRRALDKMQATKYGEALRTYFTGERDSRIAETNQLRDELRKIVPDYRDQEALSLMRDFKNKPGELQARRERYAQGDDARLKKLIPIIDSAPNPSPEMLEADRRMTDYFTQHLTEGKELGFLDSKISNEEYINHLLEPEEKAGKERTFMGRQPKIGRRFRFARERKYETILDALENPKVRAKTLNALDALTIYGDKHATAAATKLLINELKETDMGKWGFRNADNIPRDWVELSPGSELFRNLIAYEDKETGKLKVASQNLYVPQKVADALAPIIRPSTLWDVPGFRTGRLYQSYIKAVELGLSVFHMKALNVTAMNNMKLAGMVKAYASDMESSSFKGEEVDGIKSGLTTSILGRTVEAYKAAQPSTFPSRADIVRGLPGFKQADAFAQALTHETFDVMQRKFKVMDYSLKKAAWIGKHPEATADETLAAKRSIAKEVNAAYGGLQWENLAWSKNTIELSRAILLAPDWTFSNIFNAKYAFQGGPAGAAARKFWIKSALTGIALTQAMSLMVSGQPSKHPSEVYLGKDKNGKDIYSNMFFAGAPKDFLTFIQNVGDYGAITGTARTIGSKLGPLARTAVELYTNRDWMGRPIVKKDVGWVAKTVKGGEEVVSGVAPIPFSISNAARMLTDPKQQYGYWDYLSMLGGSPPRHEDPWKQGRAKRFSIRGQ